MSDLPEDADRSLFITTPWANEAIQLSVNTADVKAVMEILGAVESISTQYDSDLQRPGLAVVYRSPAAAAQAVKELNGLELHRYRLLIFSPIYEQPQMAKDLFHPTSEKRPEDEGIDNEPLSKEELLETRRKRVLEELGAAPRLVVPLHEIKAECPHNHLMPPELRMMPILIPYMPRSSSSISQGRVIPSAATSTAATTDSTTTGAAATSSSSSSLSVYEELLAAQRSLAEVEERLPLAKAELAALTKQYTQEIESKRKLHERLRIDYTKSDATARMEKTIAIRFVPTDPQTLTLIVKRVLDLCYVAASSSAQQHQPPMLSEGLLEGIREIALISETPFPFSTKLGAEAAALAETFNICLTGAACMLIEFSTKATAELFLRKKPKRNRKNKGSTFFVMPPSMTSIASGDANEPAALLDLQNATPSSVEAKGSGSGVASELRAHHPPSSPSSVASPSSVVVCVSQRFVIAPLSATPNLVGVLPLQGAMGFSFERYGGLRSRFKQAMARVL